ncbi:hypothetical protein [Natronomonas marina]|uniref:hypothetical protein n=1 Tax=Natronomonas marina TaxID=2961939 RepID=UPI0020C9F5F9|nr:hypothetical protein [Natronomonas marina]
MPESEPDFELYSTVTIERAEYTDDDLRRLPAPAVSTDPSESLVPVPPLVDPEHLHGSDTPAFVVAIHAVDPPVGSGSPDDFSSVIGFRIREKGTYTEEFEVPIFPFTLLNGNVKRPNDRAPPGGTYPPNPDGDTEVVARLWGVTAEPIPDSGEFTRAFGPLSDDPGDSARITSLDRNPSLLPINEGTTPGGGSFERSVLTPETFGDGDSPRFGMSVDIGDPSEGELLGTPRTGVEIPSGPGPDEFRLRKSDEQRRESTVVAGAPAEDHSADTGSAYVLNGIFEELEPGNAGLVGADEPLDGAEFGTAVAHDQDRGSGAELLAVGAPGDDGGDGAVYLFDRSGESSAWSLRTKFEGSGGGYGSTVDVAVDSDLGAFVLVGAPEADGSGSAELKTLEGGDSEFPVPMIEAPSELEPGAGFGAAVSLSFPFALVGAPGANQTRGAGYFFFDDGSEAISMELANEAGVALSEGDRFGTAVDAVGPFPPIVGAPGSEAEAGTVYRFVPVEGPSFSARQLSAESDAPNDADGLGASLSGSEEGPFLAGAPGGRYAALFEPTGPGEIGSPYGLAGRFELPETPSFGASVAIAPDGTRGVVGAPAANGGDGAAFLVEN